MGFFDASLFSFSPETVKNNIISYFTFSTTPVSELKGSLFNIVLISLVLAILDFIGFLLAKILDYNLFKVFYSLFQALITKSILIVFVVLFAFLMSQMYSFFGNADIPKLSYMYMFLLSSIHTPIALFLAYFKFSSLMFRGIFMIAQGVISDYLARSSIGYNEDHTTKQRVMFIITSLAAHILFYGIILQVLYTKD